MSPIKRKFLVLSPRLQHLEASIPSLYKVQEAIRLKGKGGRVGEWVSLGDFDLGSVNPRIERRIQKSSKCKTGYIRFQSGSYGRNRLMGSSNPPTESKFQISSKCRLDK